MKRRNNTYGMTLTELLIVITVMAILVGIGVTATKAVLESFESSTNVKRVISAALANARAIASKEQSYAGVRFQQDANGNHYMIFIIHDPSIPPSVPGNLGFRAVEGRKPIKLPTDVILMDLWVKTDFTDSDTDKQIDSDLDIDSDEEMNGTMTFSVIFSTQGKLVLHTLKVADSSDDDDIFDVQGGAGMFIEDGVPSIGLAELEYSRNGFVICEKKDFEKIDVSQRWSGFLQNIEACYLSPYTGQIVLEQ